MKSLHTIFVLQVSSRIQIRFQKEFKLLMRFGELLDLSPLCHFSSREREREKTW